MRDPGNEVGSVQVYVVNFVRVCNLLYNSLYLPPNFALTIVVKSSWEYADLPRELMQNFGGRQTD